MENRRSQRRCYAEGTDGVFFPGALQRGPAESPAAFPLAACFLPSGSGAATRPPLRHWLHPLGQLGAAFPAARMPPISPEVLARGGAELPLRSSLRHALLCSALRPPSTPIGKGWRGRGRGGGLLHWALLRAALVASAPGFAPGLEPAECHGHKTRFMCVRAHERVHTRARA